MILKKVESRTFSIEGLRYFFKSNVSIDRWERVHFDSERSKILWLSSFGFHGWLSFWRWFYFLEFFCGCRIMEEAKSVKIHFKGTIRRYGACGQGLIEEAREKFAIFWIIRAQYDRFIWIIVFQNDLPEICPRQIAFKTTIQIWCLFPISISTEEIDDNPPCRWHPISWLDRTPL